MNWLCCITSLPTENATLRQRAWRALKASGSAVLRDGVYLLPALDGHQATLEAVARDVRAGGGSALVLHTEAPAGTDFATLFDRSAEHAALLQDIARASAGLDSSTVQDALRQARKLRKAFTQLCAIDFFPGAPQQQVEAALQALEQACARSQAPDEPHAHAGAIPRLAAADYQGRTWATRARPWVDRLASAWLIRRFIDPQARILWLAHPGDCPPQALGFDFDGARFSHVGTRVTFEVLAASFGLNRPALARIGLLVHALDVGGVPPAEAPGIESVLAGLRDTIDDDDRLLAQAGIVFDGLLAAFGQPTATLERAAP